MKNSHSFLFQNFKVSESGENFKNYPIFINLCTILLRIFIVMMIVLQPLHKMKSVTMIVIQIELFLVYTCIILYYKPYVSKPYMITTEINYLYMIVSYLILQQQHRDHFYSASYKRIEGILIYSFYSIIVVNLFIVITITIIDMVEQRKKKKEQKERI